MTLKTLAEPPPATSRTRTCRIAFLALFLLALVARIPFYAGCPTSRF